MRQWECDIDYHHGDMACANIKVRIFIHISAIGSPSTQCIRMCNSKSQIREPRRSIYGTLQLWRKMGLRWIKHYHGDVGIVLLWWIKHHHEDMGIVLNIMCQLRK